jgi:restriction system protein
MTEKTVWGIHAGKTGDADSLFLKKNFVALGWLDMGNIGKLPPDREAFKEKVKVTYPDWKPGKIPNAAGQLYRFVHEMKTGDIIVYPSKRDRPQKPGQIYFLHAVKYPLARKTEIRQHTGRVVMS